jgi:hypothetical protein
MNKNPGLYMNDLTHRHRATNTPSEKPIQNWLFVCDSHFLRIGIERIISRRKRRRVEKMGKMMMTRIWRYLLDVKEWEDDQLAVEMGVVSSIDSSQTYND